MSKQPERRRRFVRAFAPAVGLLAAGLLVWQGSYAAFNATTTDTGSTWASGTLKLQNDGDGSGTFAASKSVNWGKAAIKPGDSDTVCINVQNTGTSSGTLNFYRSGSLTDSSASFPLSSQINLTVDAAAVAAPLSGCTGFPSSSTSVATGVSLASFPTAWSNTDAITVPAGQYAVYRVTWSFNSAAGNDYQGASTATAFTWEEQ